MSDQVEIPFDDNPGEQATLLLAAAEDLGLDADVIRTSEGGFVVSQEVKDKAYPPKKSKKTESKEG